MLVILLIIVVKFAILAYFYWTQKCSKYAKQINCFPGPTTLPILGNVHMLWKTPDKIFNTLRELAITYSTTYSLWATNIATLNIINAEAAEVLLSSKKHIEKSLFYEFSVAWLGRGILTSAGQKWKQRRKLLTPSFHFNILQKFVDTFGQHSKTLVEYLKDECDKSESNILPIINFISLQIICDTAMGTTLNLHDSTQYKYRQSVHDLAEVMVDRLKSPWLYNDFIFNMFPIGRKQKKLCNYLHTFVRNVIKEREANINNTDVNTENEDDETEKKKMALLDLLLSAKRNGLIDNDGIREEVDTFMAAGHDATSNGITMTILLLANYKEHQDKVVEELKDIFGKSKRVANYDDIQKMQYLELCIKETLRLYPTVPRISRQLMEDMPLGNLIAPASCIVNVHIFDLHRDPKYFPDPEKFDPERFLVENMKGRHPYAYLPFSAGPRNCIGQKFAMLEIKSVVSAILRNYVLESVTSHMDLEFKADFVLRSTREIKVRIRHRK